MKGWNETAGIESAVTEKTEPAEVCNIMEAVDGSEDSQAERQQLLAYQKQLMESREQIRELMKKLDYYEKENARLERHNEVLHETAWELINRVRTLEGRS